MKRTWPLWAAILALPLIIVACGDDDETTTTPDPDPDPPALSCTSMCDDVASACTGTNEVYPSTADCVQLCDNGGMDLGADGATAGNSAGCRRYHAGAAVDDPDTHCVHAGPDGAGVCGDGCDVYCALALNLCTGANELYADLATCEAACAGFASMGEIFNYGNNTDSLECRITHLQGISGDPEVHCPHAGAVPVGQCDM